MKKSLNIRTAIIMAGGQSSRMGRNKSMLTINGASLIKSVIDKLRTVFDEIIISVGDKGSFNFPDIREIPDIKKQQGPLMGLFSTMSESTSELNFVTACDIPDPDTALILNMLELAEKHDIVLPVDENGRYEPLFAVYRKSVACVAGRLLASGERKMTTLLEHANFKTVPMHSRCIRNLNTENDYKEYLNDHF
ncbi:MAG: molybdenum cofactor guanylyltransferase [Victivallales bacterium]|nr:molybdenum cofactor guanylyltransferase [Victivallales bacterium]